MKIHKDIRHGKYKRLRIIPWESEIFEYVIDYVVDDNPYHGDVIHVIVQEHDKDKDTWLTIKIAETLEQLKDVRDFLNKCIKDWEKVK